MFFACSGDDNQTQQISGSLKKEATEKTSTNETVALQTTCDIITPLYSNSDGSVTYTYTNNTGIPANTTWTADPANLITAVNGITEPSFTVNFASGFTSGTITASGIGTSPFLNCIAALNITKETIPPPPPSYCCAPTIQLGYICRGGSQSVLGFLTLIPPSNCSLNWKQDVSKIDLKLEGGPKFIVEDDLLGEISNKKSGTITNPFSSTLIDNKIILDFTYPSCVSRVTAIVTVYYNNGCPPVRLTAEALKG